MIERVNFAVGLDSTVDALKAAWSATEAEACARVIEAYRDANFGQGQPEALAMAYNALTEVASMCRARAAEYERQLLPAELAPDQPLHRAGGDRRGGGAAAL